MKNLIHQERDFQRFKDKDEAALFHEPGLGKTRIAIKLAEYNWEKGRIDGVLVVTTKTLMLNWAQEELPKHSDIEYYATVWRDEPYPRPGLQYYILNADAVKTEYFLVLLKRFRDLFPRFMLIVDESTFAKSPKSQRAKYIIRLGRLACKRIIMSGTPVTQSPLDIWSQSEILRPGILGYKNFYTLRADICRIQSIRMGSRSFDKIVGYRNLEELTENILKFGSIVKAKDVLDLPPRRTRKVPVKFTKEQEKYYTELRKEAMTTINDVELTAVNAVSLINRLMQICAGQIKIGEGQYLSIPNERINLLKEMVEESDKCIIWSPFVNTAKEIAEALHPNVAWLQSKMPIQKRQDLINQWKQNNFKDLLANQASAGHGLTLIQANHVIYYANFWSLEHRIQSEFRADRIGQTQSVLFSDLYIPGTIEEYVLDVLVERRKVADRVIQDPRGFLKEALG
jgi:SNF2 family DNA or RNA helicase